MRYWRHTEANRRRHAAAEVYTLRRRPKWSICFGLLSFVSWAEGSFGNPAWLTLGVLNLDFTPRRGPVKKLPTPTDRVSSKHVTVNVIWQVGWGVNEI